jgi:uncharacterized protein YaiL (DUF2058 family)
MDTAKKACSFVKEVVAILKGDDAEATGQKILRQADSALKTSIASMTGDTISLEDRVESAKENLKLSRLNNGKQIEDRNAYVSNLVAAQNNLIEAEENLVNHKKTLAFLEEQSANLDK